MARSVGSKVATKLKDFEARISEAACLDEIMRLRFGQKPCPACDRKAGFAAAPKRRAFSCRACGFKVYPCVGTPFAKPQPPLTHWFFALHLASLETVTARTIRRAIGNTEVAAQIIVNGITAFEEHRRNSPQDLDWIDAVSSFVREQGGAAPPPAVRDPDAAPERPGASETTWQTFKSHLPNLEGWPFVGIAAILVLAVLGAGIGWLMVPSIPEPDAELEQATVLLTLVSDRPVILVSAEVAQQLYNVSDLDPSPASPLIPTIRTISSTTGPAGPAARQVADAQPLAQPALRLSPIAGQSLLRGDLTAVKNVGSRPELAAYSSLAAELEGSGPRNPDELLVFGPMKIRRYLVEKIVKAARATAMDPVLLMAIADKESSFQTEVQAQTSSASGLFQFIERTWLGVVREFGAKYGLEAEARAIAGGDVSASERVRILALRRDAFLSAALAAEMLKRDSDRIGRRIGRQLTGGEVYLVHFLGPDGAERMLERVQNAPTAVAAELLPRPAEANKTIFYGKSGDEGQTKGLSVAEVHSKFETMMAFRLDRYRSVGNRPAPAPAPAPKPK